MVIALLSAMPDALANPMNIFLINCITMIVAVNKNMFHANKKYMNVITAFVAFSPVVAVFLYFQVCGATYQKERIMAFLHPYQYRTSQGYVYTRISDILQGAELIGMGNGKDSIDTAALANGLIPLQLMHSYGMIVGIILLVLFIIFIMHSMKIVQCQKNMLGFMVSISCFLTLTVNCCEGALMNLGLYPVTTIPIPFLTYGKSAVFVYSIFIGLLLSAHRYEKVFTREEGIYKSGWRLSIKLERK